MWHLAHSTLACLPSRGYSEVLCSVTPKSEGFQPSTVWHSAHSPFFARAENCPLWGSGLWQSAHCPKGISFLKSPPTWQAMQLTVACFPSNGYFVFEWSNAKLGGSLFHPAVVWQCSQVSLKAP